MNTYTPAIYGEWIKIAKEAVVIESKTCDVQDLLELGFVSVRL